MLKIDMIVVKRSALLFFIFSSQKKFRFQSTLQFVKLSLERSLLWAAAKIFWHLTSLWSLNLPSVNGECDGFLRNKTAGWTDNLNSLISALSSVGCRVKILIEFINISTFKSLKDCFRLFSRQPLEYLTKLKYCHKIACRNVIELLFYQTRYDIIRDVL